MKHLLHLTENCGQKHHGHASIHHYEVEEGQILKTSPTGPVCVQTDVSTLIDTLEQERRHE